MLHVPTLQGHHQTRIKRKAVKYHEVPFPSVRMFSYGFIYCIILLYKKKPDTP